MRPNARQIRLIAFCDMPIASAIDRVDQCVAPGGASSRVLTSTPSIISSLIVRGRPGRGSSTSPSRRRTANRPRHFDTVAAQHPKRPAMSLFASPAAAPNTIRQRNANACDDDGRRAQRSNVSLSAALSSTVTARRPRRRGSPTSAMIVSDHRPLAATSMTHPTPTPTD